MANGGVGREWRTTASGLKDIHSRVVRIASFLISHKLTLTYKYLIIRLREPGIENINLMLSLDHSASRKKREM